jgi:hypothetical protein
MKGGNEGSRNSRRGINRSRQHRRSRSLCTRREKLGNSLNHSCPPWCNCGISRAISNKEVLQIEMKAIKKELNSDKIEF